MVMGVCVDEFIASQGFVRDFVWVVRFRRVVVVVVVVIRRPSDGNVENVAHRWYSCRP
jgi:hypothetical protein